MTDETPKKPKRRRRRRAGNHNPSRGSSKRSGPQKDAGRRESGNKSSPTSASRQDRDSNKTGAGRSARQRKSRPSEFAEFITDSQPSKDKPGQSSSQPSSQNAAHGPQTPGFETPFFVAEEFTDDSTIDWTPFLIPDPVPVAQADVDPSTWHLIAPQTDLNRPAATGNNTANNTDSNTEKSTEASKETGNNTAKAEDTKSVTTTVDNKKDRPEPTAKPPINRRPKPQWNDVVSVAAVRYTPYGRPIEVDAAGTCVAIGDSVVVASQDGHTVASVVLADFPKTVRRRKLPKILRHANQDDKSNSQQRTDKVAHAVKTAGQLARKSKLPIKIFRGHNSSDGRTIYLYYSSEQRADIRTLTRNLQTQLSSQVELRHTGSRDEAKYVGGIGSCGQELCCTTWLPDFVPVSIKMAKDQGLSLNPSKVSGQCGRLKCCLVYEQSTYAQLRRGLPKLGKRVILEDGKEGRVVEVDVLKQQLRISLGAGDSVTMSPTQVKPMFASSNNKKSERGKQKKSRPTKRKPAQPDTRRGKRSIVTGQTDLNRPLCRLHPL